MIGFLALTTTAIRQGRRLALTFRCLNLGYNSKELGYVRLYECSMIAEIELGRGDQIRKRDVRDLRMNLIKPVASTYIVSDPKQCTSIRPA